MQRPYLGVFEGLLGLLGVAALGIYIAIDIYRKSIPAALIVMALAFVCLAYAWQLIIGPIVRGILRERRESRHAQAPWDESINSRQDLVSRH